MELYVPANLDIEAIIPPEIIGDARERYHDRVIYFCHTLIFALRNKKTFDVFMDTGQIRLMKKYLRDVMRSQTDKIISRLQQLQVINVDEQFSIGVHSMGYVFTQQYRTVDVVKAKLRSYQVKKTIREINAKADKTQSQLKRAIPNVIKQLTTNPWSIDQTGSSNWINQFETVMYSKIASSNMIPEDQKTDIITKYKHYFLYVREQIRLLQSGVHDHIVDERSGRLHNVFTSIPRPIKNFITLRSGDQMVGLDVKNCQPFLMSYLSQKCFWTTTDIYGDDRIKLMEWNRVLHNRLMKEEREARKLIIKMIESSERQSGSGLSSINFKCLVEQGQFYEFLMEKFHGKFIHKERDRFGTRDDSKIEVLRMMYFDTRISEVTFYEPFKEFKKFFPIEGKIMELLKKKNYKDFPVLLQKLESTLILEKIGAMLGDTPFLTVHDSLIVKADDETHATDIVDKAFKRYLGYAPRLGRTEYSPANAYIELNNYVDEKIKKLETRYYSKRKNVSLGFDIMSDSGVRWS